MQSQTYADVEWLIIDGDSTDGTQDDFINYSSATILSEPDKGIYDAMNKGIERATGDYIIFMNAGDLFANKNILDDLSKYCSNDPDFIYGDSLEDGHLKSARSYSSITWGMFTHHQAMLYKRHTLAAIRYNTTYKIAADYDLTLRFLNIAKNIIYIPIPICVFEVGGVSQINAKLGRDEQFTSRQHNKSCSVLLNHIIRIGQVCRLTVRKYLPRLYWNLLRNR